MNLFGHEGEKILSKILQDFGIGLTTHNARGPKELLYSYDIENEIIRSIKLRYPEISDKRLNKIRGRLWRIWDGVLCHNGEMQSNEFIPDFTKDKRKFEEELLKSFTTSEVIDKDGKTVKYDRTLRPATLEGSLLRIADITAYVAQDMIDGIREEIIKGSLSQEHMKILIDFGLTKEEILESLKKRSYTDITFPIENAVIRDIVANSSKYKIKVAEAKDKLYDLRTQNNESIVKKTSLKSEKTIIQKMLYGLIEIYKQLIIDNGLVQQIEIGSNPNTDAINIIYNSKDKKYAKDFLEKILNHPKNNEYLIKIVDEANKETRNRELRYSIYRLKKKEESKKVALTEEEKAAENYYKRSGDIAKKRMDKIQKKLQEYFPQQCGTDFCEYAQQQVGQIQDTWFDSIEIPRTERIALKIAEDFIEGIDDRTLIFYAIQAGVLTDKDKQQLKKKYYDLTNEQVLEDTDEDSAIVKLMEEHKEAIR